MSSAGDSTKICPIKVKVDVAKFQQRCLARESALVKLLESQRSTLVSMGRQLTSLRRILADKLKDERLDDEQDWEPFDQLESELPVVHAKPPVFTKKQQPPSAAAEATVASSSSKKRKEAPPPEPSFSLPAKKAAVETEVSAPVTVSRTKLLLFAANR